MKDQPMTNLIKTLHYTKSADPTVQPQWLTDISSRGKIEIPEIVATVTDILNNVRHNGDSALLAYTEKFDRAQLTPSSIRVSDEEIRAAKDNIPASLQDTIRQAAENIRAFHRAQLPADVSLPTQGGGSLRLIHRALQRVGVYVPGGTAPLPSSVLMNVIPAQAAGVPEIALATPPRADGSIAPVILFAAEIAGVTEIYRMGGAQAIAALAYGTESVPAVDKICGPGNIYVNAAKRLVYGQVDIDMFAGPSEILVIADDSANPEYLATDLLSQAEHDVLASAILITTSATIAAQTAAAIERRAAVLPRREIIQRSLRDYGAIIVVDQLEDAFALANRLAPEHLELCIDNAQDAVDKIRNAGAVFVGNYSPEPVGDYFAGPNHVLPTSGTARFFSPLNTGDFLKKMSVIDYREADLAANWQAISAFAESESLDAHADAIRVRFDDCRYSGR